VLGCAPPGTGRLEAAATGFVAAAPHDITVSAGERASAPDLELRAADRLRGVVLGPGGERLPGARVIAGPASRPFSETTSDGQGEFSLTFDPKIDSLLVRKAGYGQARIAPVPAVGSAPLEVRLGEESRVVVHLPAGLEPGASVVVTDGGGAIERAVLSGRTSVEIGGLAPGRARARLEPPRAGASGNDERTFELVAGATAEVSFTSRAAVEGTLTVDGAPAGFGTVGAFPADGLRADALGVTDARGRFRLERVPAGARRIVAEAGGGRAVEPVTVPEEGTITVDLDVALVALDLAVADAETLAPLVAQAQLVPASQASADCAGSSILGSFRDGFPELQFTVNDRSCASAGTGATGRARLVVPEPGAYVLHVRAPRHVERETDVSLARGVTTLSLALEPAEGEPEDDDEEEGASVVVLVGVPGGLPLGWLECRGLGPDDTHRQARRTAGGRVECGRFAAGPAEVVFRSPGYGSARASFEVPRQGALEVPLDVPRGGTLIVPVPAGATAALPKIVDAQGVDWAPILRYPSPELREVAGTGPAWVFTDLPPGDYTAIVGASARPRARVGSAQAVTAW
jgi:hypothetical protein